MGHFQEKYPFYELPNFQGAMRVFMRPPKRIRLNDLLTQAKETVVLQKFCKWGRTRCQTQPILCVVPLCQLYGLTWNLDWYKLRATHAPGAKKIGVSHHWINPTDGLTKPHRHNQTEWTASASCSRGMRADRSRHCWWSGHPQTSALHPSPSSRSSCCDIRAGTLPCPTCQCHQCQMWWTDTKLDCSRPEKCRTGPKLLK